MSNRNYFIKITCLGLLLLSQIAISQTTIYLARHAEKIINVKDPELTQIGKFRANNLAKHLSSVGIHHIFSTKYLRTIQTAQPISKLLGIGIEYYDPRNLEKFSLQLKKMKGSLLVIGHSNTTAELTRLLTGKKVEDIHENDYDNLYQVILNDDKIMLNHFKTIPSYLKLNN